MGIFDGSHILFFKINLGAVFLQFADGREAVNRVAGKSTDRLCQNESDLPSQGILHHLIKPVPALGGGAADALVAVQAGVLPFVMFPDETLIVIALRFVAVQLVLMIR